MSEFADLQTALENVAAQRAEIMLKIQRKQLIPVASLKGRVVGLALAVRDSVLYAPARFGGPLAAAHHLDAGLLHATLSPLMRRTLTTISKNGPPALRAAKAEGST